MLSLFRASHCFLLCLTVTYLVKNQQILIVKSLLTIYVTRHGHTIHLLHAGEGNMKIYSPKSIIFPEGNTRGEYDTRGWINFHISWTRMLLIFYYTEWKHIHVKYCWQTYFKSIGTLSQTFKNHIHNNLVTVACKWCVPSASDVFLSKNDSSGGKTPEASEGVEYDIYFTEYDFCPVWSRVLIFTHCPIKLIYLWLLIYEV